jgi:hypothetical protein
LKLRYVILHHTGVAEPHYDLMIESRPGGPLHTWRCPAWPIERATRVERIADHRRAYLDYEGEVGGGRGEVRRVAAGTFRLDLGADGHWELSSGEGQRLVLRREGQTETWVAEVGHPAAG